MRKQYFTEKVFFSWLHSVVMKNGRRSLSLKQVSFLALLLSVIFSSCQKEYTIEKQDLEYDRPVAFAGPLLNSTFTAVELVENIQENNGVDDPVSVKIDTGILEKGLLFVEYKEPFSYSWDDVVDMPSRNYSGTYPVNSLKSTNAIQSHIDTIPLNGKSTQRFDEGEFSAGNISVSLSGLNANFRVEFLNVTKDNSTLVIDNVPGGGGPASVDVSGYHVDFAHNADKTESGLIVKIDVSGIQGIPSLPITLSYDVSIGQLSPDYLTGYFGQESPMDSAFSMDVPIFKEMDFLEQVKFKGPRVFIDYSNYFGIPVKAQILDTRLMNTEGNMSEVLDLGDDDEYDLDNADWNNGNGVIPKVSQLVIGDKSNLGDLINMYPNKVEFRALATANPGGEDPNKPNFVTDRNEFVSELRLFLPFWLQTKAYVRQDTLEFDIEDMFQYEEDVDDVDPLDLFDFAEMTFRFTNGFPFDLDVNIIAEDDNNTYSDILIDNKPLFGMSAIDANGAVDTTNLKPSEFIISLSTSKLREYRRNKVKRIILYEKAGTTGSASDAFVKVHDYNFLRTKVMVEIDSNK